MFDTKEILSITGKPGLYKIAARTTKSIVVESLDDKRTKQPVHQNYQIALLDEITIFTTEEEDLRLRDVLETMFNRDGAMLPVSQKDDAGKIKSYFDEVAPNHDPERFYGSDMKKIIKWYEILVKYAPERTESDESEESKAEDVASAPESSEPATL